MAGEFEVTKLYATIIPKLSRSFEQDLGRQVQKAQARLRPNVSFKLKVDQRSVQSIANQLNHVARDRTAKLKISIQGDAATTGKLRALERNRELILKINMVNYNSTKLKIDNLTRTRTLKVGIDVDTDMLDRIERMLRDRNRGGGSPFGGGGGGRNSGYRGIAGSIDALGKSFGRLNDVAGFAGVIVSGVAKVFEKVASVTAHAAEGTFSWSNQLSGLATSFAQFGLIGVVVATVLAFVAALAAGALAAAGFAVAAVLVGAVVSTLAVAFSALGAAIAGIMGLLGAFGGALSVIALALFPIVQAFQEFTNVQNEAAPATANVANSIKQQASALRTADAAIRSAKRGIIDANHALETAQYGVVQAARGVRNATEGLSDAYSDQVKARERLNKAEEQAIENLEELRRQARDAAGEEEDAEIRLIRAKERLGELDPFADDQTDYREALRDVEQAERDLADTRVDNTKKLKKYDEAKKKGIKGNDEVIAAQDALDESNRKIRDAQEQQQTAETSLRDARFQVASATDAQREAVFRLKDAELDRVTAMDRTATATDGATSAQRKLAKEYGALTKAGQEFFESVKEAYYLIIDLGKIAQDAFLPGLKAGLDGLITLAPTFKDSVELIGRSMGDTAAKFGKFFSSREAKAAFETIGQAAADTLTTVGDAALSITKVLLPAIADLVRDSQPLMDAFADGFVLISQGVARLFDTFTTPENMAAFEATIESVSVIITGLIDMFGGFLSGIAGPLVRDLPALTDGVKSFSQGFFDALEALVRSGLLQGFGDLLRDVGGYLTDIASNGALEAMGTAMTEVLKALGEGFLQLAGDQEVLDSFVALMEAMPPLITSLVQLMPGLIVVFQDFLTTSSELFDMLDEPLFTTLIFGIEGLRTNLIILMDTCDFVAKAIEWSWRQMTMLVELAYEGMAGFFSIMVGDMEGAAEHFGNFGLVGQTFLDSWSGIWQNVVLIFQDALSVIKAGMDLLTFDFEGFGGNLTDIGKRHQKGDKPEAKGPRSTGGGTFGNTPAQVAPQRFDRILDKNATATGNLNRQFGNLNTTVGGFNGVMGTAIENNLTLAGAVDGLRGKLRQAESAERENKLATERYDQAKKNLTLSIENNGRKIAGNSKAADGNREALKNATRASYDRMLQDIKSGKPMDQAIKRHKDRTTALQNEFGKAKSVKEETQRVIDKYGKVPPNVKTLMALLGFKGVDSNLKALLTQQRALQLAIPVEQAGREVQKDLDRNRQRAYASGGTVTGNGGYKRRQGVVHGPGSGTGDKVKALLSPGEFVIKKKSADKLGRMRLNILNATGDDPRKEGPSMPRFAKGGSVTWPFKVDVSKTQIPTPPVAMDYGDTPSTAYATAKAMGASAKVLLALFQTGIVESGMKNLASRKVPESMRYPNEGVAAGDHDSVGFLQQRASWGSVKSRMNVSDSTRRFIQKARIKEKQYESSGRLAQAVQVSAYPDRYNDVTGRAQALLEQVKGAMSVITGGTQVTGGPHARLMAFGRLLESRGYDVSEGPGEFGPINRGAHSKNSRHYAGAAIDVNAGAGESDAEKAKIDRIWRLASSYGLRSIWRNKMYDQSMKFLGNVGGHMNHAHFDYSAQALKRGGLVRGPGGPVGDKIKALLSDKEFVMSAKTTQALGVNNLKALNDMGNRGALTASAPSGKMGLANVREFGGGQGPNMVDNSRNIEMQVYVTEDHQVDMLSHRMNALL